MSFDLPLPLKETLRYMGMKQENADTELLALISQCETEIRRYAQPQSVFQRVPFSSDKDNKITAGSLEFFSRDLAKNHKNCRETFMFAATLGPEIDMLIKRYQKINLSKAVVFNAAAVTAIEAYCDSINNQIKEEMKKENKHCMPRFSPGYGDVSITIQKAFLQSLNAEQKIGIRLSEGNLMIPEKSVTAFIGVSEGLQQSQNNQF